MINDFYVKSFKNHKQNFQQWYNGPREWSIFVCLPHLNLKYTYSLVVT